MHLSSLTLTNIRQFDQRTFNFQPGFNLLVGENGAGKTTILRGLLATLGGTQQMWRRPKLEDEDIRLRTDHTEVMAEVQSSNNRIEQFHYRKRLWERAERTPHGRDLPLVLLYASNEATCSAMKVKRAKRIPGFEGVELRRSEEFLYESEMELSRRRMEQGGRRFGNSQSVREFVGRVLSTFAADFRQFYWRFEPYDCSLVPPTGAEMKQLIELPEQALASSFAMRYFQEEKYQGKGRRFQWPDQPTVTLTPETSGRKPDESRLPELREIWEKMKIPPEARKFLQTCSLAVKLTPRIMIRRAIGPLHLSQLSDGEQRLFSLFVDIARQLSLKYPDDEIGGGEAIVLIDEIDVHLHPKWQRRIVPALEDLYRNCQFIATTHSPFVIQATDRQKITSIGPEAPSLLLDCGNSIEDIAEDIQRVPQPQRSVRAEKLSEAATKYFTLLKRQRSPAELVAPGELRVAERLYREASEPFTSDPAVHALLKVQLMEGDNQ